MLVVIIISKISSDIHKSRLCSAVFLYASEGQRALGVPINNQRGQSSGPVASAEVWTRPVIINFNVDKNIWQNKIIRKWFHSYTKLMKETASNMYLFSFVSKSNLLCNCFCPYKMVYLLKKESRFAFQVFVQCQCWWTKIIRGYMLPCSTVDLY